MLAQAETDLRRALILQNARVATRLDPVSGLRTARNEERLRRIGLVACVLGVVLALVLVMGTHATRGHVRPLHLGLLATFLVLTPVFVVLPRLRRAGIKRLDAMLARRAKKIVHAWPEGVQREYAVDGGSLRVPGGAARSLEGLVYGLRGEATLMLYTTPGEQNPALIVLVGSEGERVEASLPAVRFERLSRELLPTSTVERSW